MIKQLYISFYYPHTGLKLGGAQLLYARIIEFFCKNTEQKIRLYDFNDGSIRSLLIKFNVTNYDFVAIDNNATRLNNIGNEVFVVSPVLLSFFANGLEKQDSVFFVFWDLLYSLWENLFNLKFCGSIGFAIPNLRKKYLCKMINEHGFATVPEGKVYFENISGMTVKDNCILGVPIGDINYKYKKIRKDELRITYLGRSEFWKVAPVRKLLKDLLSLKEKFKLNVITDNVNDFKRHLKELYLGLEVDFKENLFGDNLTDYLIANTDIAFGMGTSAIEFAKLGMPTILADFSYNDFPDDYKYQWLYENNGRGLGQDIGINHWYGVKKLEDLLSEFRKDDSDLISKKCFDYVRRYNSMADIAQKLVELSLETKLNAKNLNCLLFRYNYFKHRLKTLIYRTERPLAL